MKAIIKKGSQKHKIKKGQVYSVVDIDSNNFLDGLSATLLVLDLGDEHVVSYPLAYCELTEVESGELWNTKK